MCRVTVGAADIVTPVLTAAKVVVLFPAGMATETSLRGFFRRLTFEGNDLLGITFLCVGPAWTMARLATGNFIFPTAYFDELSVRGVREGLELILVTVFAGIAADIVFGILDCNSWLVWFNRSGRIARDQQDNHDQQSKND